MPGTPVLTTDLAGVRDNFRTLRAVLPRAEIRYAVKANAAEPILRLLAAEGAAFDIASVGEIDACGFAGVAGSAMSFGNTVKKASDVAYAHALGVRRFAFDSDDGLTVIAQHAPGSMVECRIAPALPPSATPFGHKFGCAPADAARLLKRASRLDLRAAGLSFHVGSQQLDPDAWRIGIDCAATIFEMVGQPTSLNIGGGFPVSYTADAPSIDSIADTVQTALTRNFGAHPPDLAVEPGRFVVGPAGSIHCEVVSVRSGTDGRRWVYLDIGRYGGLAETENEYIRYRLRTARDGDALGHAVVAGPTCDGDDVLYQRYPLPVTLRAGDTVVIEAAGAYTASYASTCFNGIPSLTQRFVETTGAVAAG